MSTFIKGRLWLSLACSMTLLSPVCAAFDAAGLQGAIDAAATAGGGVVTVPKGQWETGPLILKSGVTLHLEKGAYLRGNPDPAVYRAAKTGALIQACAAEKVAITGEGTIDGRGGLMPSNVSRPHLVNFFECTNVLVQGVTLRTGGSWTLYARRCDGVTYRGVKIWAHVNHCEDGMDVASRNVLIEDCDVDADDDALVFKTPEPDMVVENVEVRNCRFASSCNAIKFGTESHGRFRNVTIHNCTLAPPSAMGRFDWRRRTPSLKAFLSGISAIAIETVDGADLSNITIRDIALSGYQVPFFVRFGHRRDCRTGRTPMLKNVLVENVTGSALSAVASSITGVAGRRVENVTFRNITLTLPGGGAVDDCPASVPEVEKKYPEALMFGQPLPASVFYVRHADGVRLENIVANFTAKEWRPAIVKDDAEVTVTNCRFLNPGGKELGTGGQTRAQPAPKRRPLVVSFNPVKKGAEDHVARFCRSRSLAYLSVTATDVPGALAAIDRLTNEVDCTRILLRGEGKGADLALAVVAAAPKRFAGAVAVMPTRMPTGLTPDNRTPVRIISGFADAARAQAAIAAYNALVPPQAHVEPAVVAAAGGRVPSAYAFVDKDPDFPKKDRPLAYRKVCGFTRLDLTQGARVSIMQPTLDWLMAQGPRWCAGQGKRRLILAGDSTLQPRAPNAPAGSWGEALRPYLASDVELVNCARGGRSTRTFKEDWNTHVLQQMRPGDWVIIQFGHNDMSKASDPKVDRQTDPDSEYMNNLHRYIADARLAGAYPLLVTSIALYPYRVKDGRWNERNALAPWVAAMKRVAQEFNVPLIDLNTLTREVLKDVGVEQARTWYMLSVNGKDTAHPVKKGARQIARLFAAEVRKQGGAAAMLLKEGTSDVLSLADPFWGTGAVAAPPSEGIARAWTWEKAQTGNNHPGALLPLSWMSACAYSGAYVTGYGEWGISSDGPAPRAFDRKYAWGFTHVHRDGCGNIKTFYNFFLVTPAADKANTGTRSRLDNERATPGYYAGTLTDYNTAFELTAASCNANLHRLRFPVTGGKLRVDMTNHGMAHDNPKVMAKHLLMKIDPKDIVAEKAAENIWRGTFKVYNMAIHYCFAVQGAVGQSTYANGMLDFAVTGPQVESALAFSVVSPAVAEQEARAALAQGFDRARVQASTAWRAALSTVEAEFADPEEARTFYGALYHSFVKPAFNGKWYTDYATCWDMYNTQFPLLFSLAHDHARAIVEHIWRTSEHEGFFPNVFNLAEFGYNRSDEQAVGLPAQIMADAFFRGVTTKADWPQLKRFFRNELYGFDVPKNSPTYRLDLACSYGAAAKVAAACGDVAWANELNEKAGIWRAAYDPATGLLPRQARYYEGNERNYSFRPHPGMNARIQLAGGAEKFETLLEEFFGYRDDLSSWQPTKDRVRRLGRFEGFNNESDMVSPNAWFWVGRLDRVSEIHDLGRRCRFGAGEGGCPGNNDTGGMGSWYVWSALGLVPQTGTPYVFTVSPAVERAKVKFRAGTLEITVARESVAAIYPTEIRFNGKKLAHPWIALAELMRGGKLEFTLRNHPGPRTPIPDFL